MNNNKMNCVKCESLKRNTEFYMSTSPLHNGKVPYCKSCIRKLVDSDNVETIKDAMRMMDKPFIHHLWVSAGDEASNLNKDRFGVYMKNVAIQQYKDLTWKDSIYTNNDEEILKVKSNDDTVTSIPYNLESLKEKYGHGYQDNEYILFEKKFFQLKPSFQLPTTMHEEYLREYCVNKVKETMAKTKGEFKEAKEWAAMAKESAEAGKLKPSQMSKADLSQGLDGFGQLARMVEEKIEMQKVLPKFIKRPKDDVDVTLWLYINYIRDLKSLPEVEYKEIWKFYEDRYEDYMSQSLDYGSESDE